MPKTYRKKKYTKRKNSVLVAPLYHSSLWVNIKKNKGKRYKKVIPAFLKGKKEKFFLIKTVALFERNGWKCHHHDTLDIRKAWLIGPGFPDLVMVKKVRRKGKTLTKIIWVELKTERGYPSKQQREWLDLLPKSNTFLFRPHNWRAMKQLAEAF